MLPESALVYLEQHVGRMVSISTAGPSMTCFSSPKPSEAWLMEAIPPASGIALTSMTGPTSGAWVGSTASDMAMALR